MIDVTRVGFMRFPDAHRPELQLQRVLRAMVDRGHRIIAVNILAADARSGEAYEVFIVSDYVS